jgi:hypothetical protein
MKRRPALREFTERSFNYAQDDISLLEANECHHIFTFPTFGCHVMVP